MPAKISERRAQWAASIDAAVLRLLTRAREPPNEHSRRRSMASRRQDQYRIVWLFLRAPCFYRKREFVGWTRKGALYGPFISNL
jgi:hypothetical protein